MKVNKRTCSVTRVALILACIVLPAGAALAQAQPGFDEREAARQKRQIEQQRKAREAADKRLPAAENITYADVLKSPDDIDLNFRYAKAQVARGNVRGASATLERILLITPDLPQVRLTYAIVLFRLDNIDEAEREFLKLKKLKMAASLRAEIDRFLAAIKFRRQKTKYRVRVSLGLKRDSNVNAGAQDGKVLIAGFEFVPIGRAQKQPDFAALGVITGEVTQDLGKQARDELLVSATYYHNEQFAIDTQDVQSGSASVALRLPFSTFTMTPRLSYTDLGLSREKYFSGASAEVLFERRNVIPDVKLDGFFRVRGTRERFHNIFESGTARQQSGFRWEWEAGLRKQISPSHRLEGTVVFTRKLPQSDAFNDYRGHKLGFLHTWVIGDGQFLLTGVDYAVNLYKVANPLITSRQVRKDKQLRLRVTYGAPLGNFISESYFGASGAKYYDVLKDLTWTVTAELYSQDSNIRNFEYVNRRIQTMLTKTWNF